MKLFAALLTFSNEKQNLLKEDKQQRFFFHRKKIFLRELLSVIMLPHYEPLSISQYPPNVPDSASQAIGL